MMERDFDTYLNRNTWFGMSGGEKNNVSTQEDEGKDAKDQNESEDKEKGSK